MAEGLRKTGQEMELAHTVKDALNAILDSATRSSNRAADTAQVIQQTADSSRAINKSMNSVTEMVAKIRAVIQRSGERYRAGSQCGREYQWDVGTVNRANIEQKRAAEEIERSMEEVTEQFFAISDHTETLKQDFYSDCRCDAYN